MKTDTSWCFNSSRKVKAGAYTCVQVGKEVVRLGVVVVIDAQIHSFPGPENIIVAALGFNREVMLKLTFYLEVLE